MKMFKKNDQAKFAPGFPETSDVHVIFDKISDVITVKNGFNVFRVRITPYEFLTIQDASDGVFNIAAKTKYTADNATMVNIASFGSKRAAENAIDALAKKKGFAIGWKWLKWALYLFLLYAVFNIVGGAIQAVAQQQARQHVDQIGGIQPQVMPQMHSAGPGIQISDASTQMAMLANGGRYEFKPNLVAPQFQAPQLACNDTK